MYPRRSFFPIVLALLALVGIFAGWQYNQTASHSQRPMTARIIPRTDGNKTLVTDKNFLNDAGTPAGNKSSSTSPKLQNVSPDTVSAEAYLVGNVETGKIYLAKDIDTVLPVASMSKLVTAIAATDTLAPTTTITITPEEADTYPDHSHIHAGETFTVHELLYPLLMDSSNIAANTLASSTNLQTFMNLMNSYAWEIGMNGAFFQDPSGLSAHNTASARDFFALARYLYKNRPDILAITRIAQAAVSTTTLHEAHDFVNIHPFVSDPRFLGGKTGHTNAALDTMMTIMDIQKQPLVFVVLRSDDRRQEDTNLLIDQVEHLLNK